MKNHLFISIIFISIISFYGCSSNENETSTVPKKEPEFEISNKSDKNKTEGSDQKVPEDQENLKLGDTAVIQSTLGTAEITIKTFKEVKDVKGVGPQRAHFFISDIELKNVGDNTFKAADWMELLEMAWDLEVTGAPEDSDLYEVQAVSGDLAPGDTANGEVIFDVDDSEEYLLMAERGLLAGGGIYNNAVWTLKKSDLK